MQPTENGQSDSDRVESDARVAELLDSSFLRPTQSLALSLSASQSPSPSPSPTEPRITTTDELIRSLQRLPAHEQVVHLVPYIERLHRIIHHILPRPNKGIWEPALNLDPFILSYLVTMDHNRRLQHHSANQASSSSEQTSVEKKADLNDVYGAAQLQLKQGAKL
ncbi:Type II secretion system (T2SS)-associated protein Gcp13 [Andalucia godoyi]|uniref:Type II secretion system (T2SS)-associated protein Gcp13 n=1 Tax=Andalucia godoyi TaxID=505711 RepID=A0A8K0AI61_ANDGO|nr:Type II secretion system (T2SS)-associated protein Gcp13 [Andalucia godoyi]|eukprot:ANDGO_02103.mRNA.1 Type II secretion system (T2SS)-associated protein Gcp13